MSAEEQRAEAAGLLDKLTFGGHSYDGATSVLAEALEKAVADGVHDFLQWLATQDIDLAQLSSQYEVLETYRPGELLERWKSERADG